MGKLIEGTYQNRRGDFLQIEERNGTFLDQYGRLYAPNGVQWGHAHKSTGNVDLGTLGTTDGWRDEAEYARTKWPDAFDVACQQESDEREDEAELIARSKSTPDILRSDD